MTGPSPPTYLIIGVSHRTGTAALRERLFADEAGRTELLAALRGAGLGQALVLSTCDRTELHAITDDPPPAAAAMRQILARQGSVTPADIAAQGYELIGDAALRQLFAVASSLDSVVVGEPQVLGQVKDSHRFASAVGMIGPQLEAALRAAYGAAKRVRSETAVGERPVSIAAAAIQMARGVHGDLARCAALLLGGGEMGELMAAQLRQAGLAHLTVLHKSAARGALIAHRLGAHVRPLDELAAALADADILIAALGDEREIVTVAAIRQALRARRQRPMICIDSAVPGDIEPAVHDLHGAFRFDLGDLERLAVEGQSARAAAIDPAWAILDAEVAAFAAGAALRQAAPAVVALRRHFEAVRDRVLAENPGADAATVARLLVNRLLHAPSAALRDLAANATVDDGAELVAIERLLARLFGAAGAEGAAADDGETRGR
ncbi:MAG TPA: glutamyl-tRNA reductase [Candidatus Acidoferrum sp.]|nr:glutamyl-tRNA reductase [Candidatus Acidoferrum sp.]